MKVRMRFFWAGVAIGAALMWRERRNAQAALQAELAQSKQYEIGTMLRNARLSTEKRLADAATERLAKPQSQEAI